MKRHTAAAMAMHGLSRRRACGLIGITRRGYRHAPAEDPNHGLRRRLRVLAEERRRWGCPMPYQLVRREGFSVNHKRAERLCREAGPSLRRRRRRKRLSYVRAVRRERPQALNHAWAVDFVHYGLLGGRRKIAQWRFQDHRERPHSSLGYLAPEEFAARNRQRRSEAGAPRRAAASLEDPDSFSAHPQGQRRMGRKTVLASGI